MKFTYTKWLCHRCSMIYEGYGSEAKHVEDYSSDKLECENDGCSRKEWFLLRYRIPEMDIRFRYDRVLVDGKTIRTKDGSDMHIEYKKDGPEYESLEAAKKLHFNVHTEASWWLNFGAWKETIHWDYPSDELVSDDIWEAFQIYVDHPVRRAIYRSEFVDCPADDPDVGYVDRDGHGQKQINCRVEYY